MERPNLIYVFADQLRYDACGFTGNIKAKTPNIDALAKEGVNFCNAVSGHPLCAPYRASLFTGKYTTSTGMVINELRINPNHTCLAHILTQNGYKTAYIGKWHLWANQLGNHYDPKNSYVPPGPYRLGFDGFWAAYNFHHEYYQGYYHTNSPEKIFIEGYEPDGQTDIAIDVIKEYASFKEPFALFLSYGTPHDPWTPDNVPENFYKMFKDVEFNLPPNYKEENDPYSDQWGKLSFREREELTEWMRIYYAMVANLDWNVGRLLETIDILNLRNNTIFIFTSDHGEMFGAHGRRAKNIFYEEAVRVPFIIRWPGKIPSGYTTDVCLNTPDIMPTLLSLLNLPVPEEVEGMDLSHFVLGQNGPGPEAAFMMGTGAVADWEDGHEWRALRDKRYTYAIFRVDRKEFLFDNIEDPYQMKNLVGDPQYRDKLDYFRNLLRKKMEELSDTFEASTWYRDNWTRDRIIIKTARIKG